jgi:hypothetical protein
LTVYYCCKACQERDWKEGGENRHKVQCKSLIEMKARYVEKAKREIEEQTAMLVVLQAVWGTSGGGQGPSSNVSDITGFFMICLAIRAMEQGPAMGQGRSASQTSETIPLAHYV